MFQTDLCSYLRHWLSSLYSPSSTWLALYNSLFSILNDSFSHHTPISSVIELMNPHLSITFSHATALSLSVPPPSPEAVIVAAPLPASPPTINTFSSSSPCSPLPKAMGQSFNPFAPFAAAPAVGSPVHANDATLPLSCADSSR